MARDTEFVQFSISITGYVFKKSQHYVQSPLDTFSMELVSSLPEPGKIFRLPGQIEYARSDTILLFETGS